MTLESAMLADPDIVSPEKIPQLRIIGSKHDMLWNLLRVIRDNEIEGSSFFDIFGGSGAVGRFFKRKYSIMTNDNLYCFHVVQRALITLNDCPRFEALDAFRSLTPQARIAAILSYINGLKDTEGFIYLHYTPASKDNDGVERKYFSRANGKRVDSARAKIQDWLDAGSIDPDEYYFLLASLIIAVQKISNISGTYGAFNKYWDARAYKPLVLRPIEVIPSRFDHKAYCEDSFDLIERIRCDIAYADPPYNNRQYIANYHILETIARNDSPEILGITGIRRYAAREKSDFCSKNSVRSAFRRLLERINTDWLLLSYNSEGLLSRNEILRIFDSASRFQPVRSYEFPHRRFKSRRDTTNHPISEYVFVTRMRK
jgi:adenine-specific DNA-methyltransferase